VAAVRQLAEHYHTSPAQLSEEQLRHYFLYLTNEKKVARATATIALCGIKFFCEHTLQRQWSTLQFIRRAREKKLPVVLSPGGSAPRAGCGAYPGLPRLSDHHLCLRAAAAGRDSDSSRWHCGLLILSGTPTVVA
jgi:hypothetical protein